MKYAPIALFVYARPWHTQQTIEALQKNTLAVESDLFIFSDAGKDETSCRAVQQVRDYARGITGFKSVTIVERERNLGLANSIIDGVSQLCEAHGRVIVLEDDMLTSPYFLQYMNQALDRYADEYRVASIHGYIYPVRQSLPETFFLRGADCWGWATWHRAWQHFNPDGKYLLDELKRRKLIRAFSFNGAAPFVRMLKGQIRGANNSWAIRWHASVFLEGMLTLYPGHSLVHNIGVDGSGTHCDASSSYRVELHEAPIMLNDIPIRVSAEAERVIQYFFWAGLPMRVLRKLANHVKRFSR